MFHIIFKQAKARLTPSVFFFPQQKIFTAEKFKLNSYG